MTPVTIWEGTLGPFPWYPLDAKVQGQMDKGAAGPRSLMAKSPRRILISAQLAVLLILLALPARLMGQQLALSTTPEILAGSTIGSAGMEPAPALAATATNRSLVSTSAGGVRPVILVTLPTPAQKPVPHPFWDRQNRILFTANGAMAVADFAVTRRNLASNGKELNPVTALFAGSTPALATNFALETGGVIGVSYLFHKTGHHKLERMTSYLNLGGSAFAVSYSLAHR